MLLMFLASLGLSWYAVRAKRAREQKQAVGELRKLGGYVLYDYELPLLRKGLDPGDPPGPAWLRGLLGEDFFATAVYVQFVNSPLTDAGLEHIRRLTELQELTLDYTRVTDAGLKHLKGLRQLRSLDIVHAPITDSGLGANRGNDETPEVEPRRDARHRCRA